MVLFPVLTTPSLELKIPFYFIVSSVILLLLLLMEPNKKRQRVISNTACSFHLLPPEMVSLIAWFLRTSDCGNLSLVSSVFNAILAPGLWAIKNEMRFRVRLPSLILFKKMMLLRKKYTVTAPVQVLASQTAFSGLVVESLGSRNICLLRFRIPCDTWINVAYAQKYDPVTTMCSISLLGIIRLLPEDRFLERIVLSQPVSPPHADRCRLHICSGSQRRGLLMRSNPCLQAVDDGRSLREVHLYFSSCDQEFVTSIGVMRKMLLWMRQSNASHLKIIWTLDTLINKPICLKLRFVAGPLVPQESASDPLLYQDFCCESRKIEVVADDEENEGISRSGCRCVINVIGDSVSAKIWRPAPVDVTSSFAIEFLYPFVSSFDDSRYLKLKFAHNGWLMMECISNQTKLVIAQVVVSGLRDSVASSTQDQPKSINISIN